MRMFVIKQETDVGDLTARLLGARVNAGQRESALEALRRANPHVDLQNLRQGTVLLLPNTPAFKASAGTSVFEHAVDDFADLVKTGLDAAFERANAAREQRVAENTEISKTLKTAAFKRALENDPELRREGESAAEELKKDSEESVQSVKLIGETRDRALDALKKLSGTLRDR
jgi:hypothetical protein